MRFVRGVCSKVGLSGVLGHVPVQQEGGAALKHLRRVGGPLIGGPVVRMSQCNSVAGGSDFSHYSSSTAEEVSQLCLLAKEVIHSHSGTGRGAVADVSSFFL